MRKITLKKFLDKVKLSLSTNNGKLSSLLKYCPYGYQYLGNGASRIVFKRGNWVLKIPYSKFGVKDNMSEATLFKKNRGICFPWRVGAGRGRLAKCKLIDISKIPCLKMEYLRPSSRLAGWVFKLSDGEQVGRDSKGRLKVYDYALEIDNALQYV